MTLGEKKGLWNYISHILPLILAPTFFPNTLTCIQNLKLFVNSFVNLAGNGKISPTSKNRRVTEFMLMLHGVKPRTDPGVTQRTSASTGNRNTAWTGHQSTHPHTHTPSHSLVFGLCRTWRNPREAQGEHANSRFQRLLAKIRQEPLQTPPKCFSTGFSSWFATSASRV